jgi:putative alpha-1,2-mannosidase
VAFGGVKPSPVTEPNDGQNYYRLSSTFQYFYTASSTSPYSANIYRIAARTPSVSDNRQEQPVLSNS